VKWKAYRLVCRFLRRTKLERETCCEKKAFPLVSRLLRKMNLQKGKLFQQEMKKIAF